MERREWCDAHAHLQNARFAGRLDGVLFRARTAGVRLIHVNGTREEDWAAVLKLGERESAWVTVSLGMHPWHAGSAAAGWEGLLFSFQHTPLLPPGRCVYGYENAPETIVRLKQSGYRGTLSGHYHPGMPLAEESGLQFLVQNALCEPPFAGTLLRIGGAGIVSAEPFGVGKSCIFAEEIT